MLGKKPIINVGDKVKLKILTYDEFADLDSEAKELGWYKPYNSSTGAFPEFVDLIGKTLIINKVYNNTNGGMFMIEGCDYSLSVAWIETSNTCSSSTHNPKHKCPKCGSAGDNLAVKFYCSNNSYNNYHP